MSMLNDSVMIYEPSPKFSLKDGNSKKNKSPKKTKRTYYESPLKHISRSSKICQLKRTQQRLMRSLSHSAKKKKLAVFDIDNASLQDSVIILSDNESGTQADENTGNTNKSTQNLHENNRLSITPKRHKVRAKSKLRGNGKRKKNQDDDSCIFISDTDDSEPQIISINADGENIEPAQVSDKQGKDDITMVWAAKENSAVTNKCVSQSHRHQIQNSTRELNERIYTVDNIPNFSNLKYLRSETEPKRKKPRLDDTVEDNRLIFNRPGLTLPTAKSHKAKTTLNKKHKSTTSSTINSKHKESESRTVADPETSNVQNNNIYPGKLREIVIDGCNIAMAHTNGKSFSEVGLQLVIDYFKTRGHVVKAFVSHKYRSIHRPILEQFHTQEIVVFTPSRYIAGKRITSYDDRFILQYATMCGGIVVSLDQYRDLYLEKPEWRDTIEKRLLAPTFVGNYVMFPEDPLGRNGPRLNEFLRH